MNILQKDNIKIWATRYDRMNDPMEYIWAKEHIVPQMEDFANKNNLNHDPEFEMFPYVISFCKSHDNLCMWKMYCNDGLGYILEFKHDIIKQTAELAINKYQWNDVLQEITYTNELNLHESIKETYDTYNFKHLMILLIYLRYVHLLSVKIIVMSKKLDICTQIVLLWSL